MNLPLGAKAGSTNLGLFIKPKSCVLVKANVYCEQLVQVHWVLAEKQPVCLYIKGRSRALACWKNQAFNTSDFMIETDKKLNFELKHGISGKLIYSTSYKVYKKIAHYRKKRKNPWSFY